MAFAILRLSKQKGGSVGASGHHNDRTRDTPNADPKKTHLNRLLLGEDKNVRELVEEVVREHGGKPRRDSVEAVEMLMTASPEFFVEKDPRKFEAKIDRFCHAAQKFLDDPRVGGKKVKAVLHMDEATPHIHVHLVPIGPDGRLNAKHYYGSRGKLRELQNVFAGHMAPLGLKRGIEHSHADHVDIKKFYGSIRKDPEFNIDRAKLPDPPKLLLTQEARDLYKEAVARGVLEQFKDDFRTLTHQAMLAKREFNLREEMERRAAERLAEVEREAQRQLAEAGRQADERYQNLARSTRALIEENRELRKDKRELLTQRNDNHDALLVEKGTHQILRGQLNALHARLTDIPLVDVLDKLGYGRGEEQGTQIIYRNTNGHVAMRINGQIACDGNDRLICRNSVDLVRHMVNMHRHGQYSIDDAVGWLAHNFNEGRASAAYLINCEQAIGSAFARQRDDRARERTTPERTGRDNRAGHSSRGGSR